MATSQSKECMKRVLANHLAHDRAWLGFGKEVRSGKGKACLATWNNISNGSASGASGCFGDGATRRSDRIGKASKPFLNWHRKGSSTCLPELALSPLVYLTRPLAH